jgi:hypothetical protein
MTIRPKNEARLNRAGLVLRINDLEFAKEIANFKIC